MTKPINAPEDKSASTTPVLVARRPGETGNIRLSVYPNPVTDDVLVANSADVIHDPFSETAAILEKSPRSSTTISPAEIDALTKIGDCTNQQCKAELRTTPEHAATLAHGAHVTCVLCDTRHVIGQDKVLASAPLPEAVSPAAAEGDAGAAQADQPVVPGTSAEGTAPAEVATADGDDEQQQQGDDEQQQQSDADDEQMSDDDEQMSDDDEQESDEQQDEEDLSTAASVDVDELVSMVDDILAETASAEATDGDTAETANAEVAEVLDQYQVNLTGMTDFDADTVTASAVKPGLLALFAKDLRSDQIVHIGMLDAEQASAENAAIYREPKDLTVAAALRAFTITVAEGEKGDLTPFGFSPIIRTIDLPSIVAEKASAETASAAAQLKKDEATLRADYRQAIEIAAAGANKGLFDNPLVDSLTDRLNRAGVQHAASMARGIVAEAAHAYIKGVLEHANTIVGQTAAERNAYASVVIKSKSVVEQSGSTDSHNDAGPGGSVALEVSSASLGGLVVDELFAQETARKAAASAAPAAQPAQKKRSLFAPW